MGTRLIEEFLAKTSALKCADFKETAEMISKVKQSSLKKRWDSRSFWAYRLPSPIGPRMDLNSV